MLSDIKKKSTGWIGSFIIAILALLVCLSGMQYYLTSNNKEPVVVTVDGHDITKRSLDKLYQINKVSLESGENAAPLTQSELVSLKQDLLEILIYNQLKLNYANENSMQVPAIIRDRYLYSQDMFKENNKFSVSRYEQIINAVAGSEAAYLYQINNDLLAQQLVVAVTNTAFVLPNETKSIAKLINEARDIRYVKLSPDSAQSAEITSDEIKDYYSSHQADFIDDAKVKVDYVVIDNNNIAKKLAPTTAEVTDFYQENSHLFPGYKNVTYNIYTLAGSDGEANAIELTKLQNLVANDNANSAMLGEYIASKKNKIAISDNTVATNIAKISDKEVKNRLASMQPSDLAVYENDSKLILLELKEAVLIPYNKLEGELKQAVKNSYIAKNTELKFAKLIEEVTDLAYTEDNLINIAKVADSKINTSDYFTAVKGESLVTKNEDVRKMAFSDDLIVDKLNSSVINLDANKVIIFRVKDYLSASPKTLAEAKTKITKILKDNKVAAELNAEADKIIKNTLANKNNKLDWVTLNNVARVGIVSRFGMEIRDEVFQMPIGSKSKPSLTKTTLENGDVVVMQVMSHDFPKNLKVSESEIESEYERYWASWNLYGFENSLRSKAEVKYTNKQA